MPKVSVIVPVYNVEKYLEKCIDSVINQTLKDIEIICVDDGSTDACPNILDNYALNDSRVKVIHQENSGYGKAMNVGFSAASGEYIGIVESDDFILPEMYETLYNCAVKNDLDIIKSDFYFYFSNIELSISSHNSQLIQYYNKILTPNERKNMFLFGISNWSGIYKKDFIVANDIKHHETPGASFQDVGFWILVMSMCKRFMIIDKAFYMYRQDNPASSFKSKDKMMCVINEHEWAGGILKSKGMDLEWKLCKLYQQIHHISTFRRIDNSLKKDYVRVIKEDYLKYKDIIKPFITIDYKISFKFIEDIIESSDSMCNNICSEIENIKNKINEAQKILIYGAGIRAFSICLKLYRMGYYSNIFCVAISSEPKENDFLGKPLVKIDHIDDKSALVLVSVKKDTLAYSEITENLSKLGFHNIIDTESFNYIF